MIRDGIYFHNVAETAVDEADGQRLCRLPEALRLDLNEIAQDSGKKTGGVELRFRMRTDEVKLTFEVLNPEQLTGGHAVAEVYHGTFPETSPRFLGTHVREIAIKRPAELEALRTLAAAAKLPYPPDLVRVLLPYETQLALVRTEGGFEPPKPGDMPSRTLLVYGSSISSGASAVRPSAMYAARTAAKLGAELRSLSVAGGAMADEPMADYIAGLGGWDAALIELGINLIWDVPRGVPGSADAFREKVDVFLSRIARAHPDKWIFVTDLFAYKGDLNGDALGAAFRDIVADKVRRLASPRIVHLSGLDLLPDPKLLTYDLIHPSEEGLLALSDRLAARIAAYWPPVPEA